MCPGPPRRAALNDCAAMWGVPADSAGSIARMAPGPHLSDLGRGERRIGRQHRNGNVGVCVRDTESRQHLVSHQPSCRSCLSGIPETCTPAAEFISCRCFRHCLCSARTCVHLFWDALWRDVAHVPTPPDFAWRIHRPGAVVRVTVHNPGTAESTARESY